MQPGSTRFGISKRTLYNHFPSKDALVLASLGERFDGRGAGHPAPRNDPQRLRPDRARDGSGQLSWLPLRQRRQRERQRCCRARRRVQGAAARAADADSRGPA
ncbi:TetR/AcrR family transcriptional regulator [Acuticoccus sp.]|uniref:TetR/AcrR family transcriptional regulator n=1 Tax=Acuticoccus sp. TaxID=1904378 RepID=UPI003B52FEA9